MTKNNTPRSVCCGAETKIIQEYSFASELTELEDVRVCKECQQPCDLATPAPARTERYHCKDCDYIGDKESLQNHVLGTRMVHRMALTPPETESVEESDTDEFIRCLDIVTRWFKDEEADIGPYTLGRMASRLKDQLKEAYALGVQDGWSAGRKEFKDELRRKREEVREAGGEE